MARREVRILKYTKLGLVSSVVACGAGLAALVFILSQRTDDGLIDAGRLAGPLIMLAVVGCLVCGFPGFLLSLEGAAGLEGKWRKLGWVGFWVGAGSTMLGLALGLFFYFFRF